MFFISHRPIEREAARSESQPPPAKARLRKSIRDNWLFVVGAGTLALAVLTGLW
jgi:hypothetical protein